jgi:hypothetical protein
MTQMDWQQVTRRWQGLPPEEQLRIRLSGIPRRVARSMAFEGEPVDERPLEAALSSRLAPSAT